MKTFKLFLSVAILLFAFGLFNESCAAKVVYLRKAPPTKRIVVVKGNSPYKGSCWVNGHWMWEKNRYVWTAGRWIKPRKGFVWINGHWQKTLRGWNWQTGYWKRIK